MVTTRDRALRKEVEVGSVEPGGTVERRGALWCGQPLGVDVALQGALAQGCLGRRFVSGIVVRPRA